MKINNRQQLLIVLTVGAFVLFVGDQFVFEPLLKWWKARSTAVAALREQVKEGKNLIQREVAVRSRWDQMRTNTLPYNSSMAEEQVFKAFDGWARVSNANITGITPQWKNDSDDYMTLNCHVEASGNLSTLSQFLYNIEKDSMALKLDSMELSARDNTGQQLTLDLEISGLVLLSQAKP
jgi:Tfp pilus assembly protein PilO